MNTAVGDRHSILTRLVARRMAYCSAPLYRSNLLRCDRIATRMKIHERGPHLPRLGAITSITIDAKSNSRHISPVQ
jgi:hypothetical protein